MAHTLARETQKCDETDPELARLIDAWPGLPPAIRAGILAMIDAAAKHVQ